MLNRSIVSSNLNAYNVGVLFTKNLKKNLVSLKASKSDVMKEAVKKY